MSCIGRAGKGVAMSDGKKKTCRLGLWTLGMFCLIAVSSRKVVSYFMYSKGTRVRLRWRLFHLDLEEDSFMLR